MNNYTVVLDIGASVSREVEANSIDEAIDLFTDDPPSTSLCHHCSREVDIHDGDAISVYDENSKELFNDRAEFNRAKSQEISDLKLEVEALKKELNKGVK